MGVLKYSPTGRAPWREVGTITTVADAAGLGVDAARKALVRAQFGPIEPAPVDRRSPLYDIADAVALLSSRPGKGRRRT